MTVLFFYDTIVISKTSKIMRCLIHRKTPSFLLAYILRYANSAMIFKL